MKKIIGLLAMAVAMDAGAVVMTLKNNAGGEVVISDRVCKLKDKEYPPLKEAYAYSSDGSTFNGCWTMKDGRVWVMYVGGDERLYDPANFVVKDTQ